VTERSRVIADLSMTMAKPVPLGRYAFGEHGSRARTYTGRSLSGTWAARTG
jgi:hypothetical protein